MLAYLDESYVRERDYFVAISLVSVESSKQLDADIGAIASEAAFTYGLSAPPELHGTDLFNGKRDFRPLHSNPDARIAIYRSGLDAFAAATPWVLLVHASWNPSLSVDEHRLRVIEAALPHVESNLEKLGQSAHIIADREPSTEAAVEEAFNAYCKERATRGTNSALHSLTFEDSHVAGGIQATDLFLYLHRRIAADAWREGRARAKRTNRWLWSAVNDRLVAQYEVIL